MAKVGEATLTVNTGSDGLTATSGSLALGHLAGTGRGILYYKASRVRDGKRLDDVLVILTYQLAK